MEIIGFVLGAAALIGAYIGIRVYFKHVSEKYGYDITKSWTRFIPVLAWIGVIVIEEGMEGNKIPMEIAVVVVCLAIYALILYFKTKSIVHSIVVALLQTIVAFVVAIVFLFKIVLGAFTGGNSNNRSSSAGNVDIYQYDNAGSNSGNGANPNRVNWEEEDEMAAAAEDKR